MKVAGFSESVSSTEYTSQALCVINASFSVAAIVLVQLNDLIAPRIRPLYRL